MKLTKPLFARLFMRLASVLAGMLAALTACIPARAEDTLARIARTKVMVEAVNQSYPPFSFLNDHNEMDGFDIEVARAVAERLGARLRVETPSWEILSAGRWRGRWDVCICSLTPDKQKAEVLDFVAPYYQAPAVLVTSAKNTAMQSPRDMNGKRIGVEQGSSYERYLDKSLVIVAPDAPPLRYPFETVRAAVYANEDLAFQDLALGAGKRIDGVVSNLITAQARMARSPGKFKLVGQPLYAEPNWVVTDKGDTAFQRRLVQVLAGLKKDGTLGRLSLKWLGRDATQ
jgi:polar amino acid transport system substrate-binding protein